MQLTVAAETSPIKPRFSNSPSNVTQGSNGHALRRRPLLPGLLNATLASTIPPLSAAQRAIHRISILCGPKIQPPSLLQLTNPQPLPDGPTGIPVNGPAELLRQRPDIRAAERSLAAATARIGVEVADLFPARLTFVGNRRLAGPAPFLASPKVGSPIPMDSDLISPGRLLTWVACINKSKLPAPRRRGSLAIYQQTVLSRSKKPKTASPRLVANANAWNICAKPNDPPPKRLNSRGNVIVMASLIS